MAAKKSSRRKSTASRAFFVHVTYQIPEGRRLDSYCSKWDERIQAAAWNTVWLKAIDHRYRTLLFRTRRLQDAWDVAHRLLDLWESSRAQLPLSVRVSRMCI